MVVRSEDCREIFLQHENNIKKGISTKHKQIKCEVPFGYGAQDTFQIQLYSEKIKGEMKSGFFVNRLGLALTTSTQSPMHVLRPLGQTADIIASAVYNLDKDEVIS